MENYLSLSSSVIRDKGIIVKKGACKKTLGKPKPTKNKVRSQMSFNGTQIFL